MNIFFLHIDPKICAQYHCDKHVVKMILEYTQLLCCVWHVIDPNHEIYTPPYKMTHKNHPCAIWVRKSLTNYKWLCDLAICLCKEYTLRYKKTHKCENLIIELTNNLPKIDSGWTYPPKAMPDEFKKDSTLMSYKTYYKYGKSHLHSWSGRDKPQFVKA
jgi:hypothetical protein